MSVLQEITNQSVGDPGANLLNSRDTAVENAHSAADDGLSKSFGNSNSAKSREKPKHNGKTRKRGSKLGGDKRLGDGTSAGGGDNGDSPVSTNINDQQNNHRYPCQNLTGYLRAYESNLYVRVKLV